MLHFREHTWLPRAGANVFSAHILTQHRTPADVFWNLNLRYTAGGSIWRRVPTYTRPQLWLTLACLRCPGSSWRDLTQLDFWSDADHEMPWHKRGGGFLDVDYYPLGLRQLREHSFVGDHVWRVTGRDGAWFTVELACLPDGRSFAQQLGLLPELVTADGATERVEPDAEFWKKNSELYLVENVPFGLVTVNVPRNAANPETYALARARQLTGVGEPEHLDIREFKNADKPAEAQFCDYYAELHFHGFYED